METKPLKKLQIVKSIIEAYMPQVKTETEAKLLLDIVTVFIKL